MSTLNVATLQNSGGTGTAATLASINGGPISGARNRIINGDMRIDQRNAGASITPTTNTYCLDRWRAIADVSSKFSVQQVSDAPAGFSFSAKATSLSAYTVGAAEIFGIWQSIEGFNSADFAFGTASAKAITVSFWVKSSLTGTFGGSITNSGYTRCYPFSYTISVANTWEYKAVTIPGDTTGTWVGATNGEGMLLYFSIGAGSSRVAAAGVWTGTQYSFAPTGATSVVGTNGATFYLTGVQLEAGTVATPFERRSYGQELALCQRYFFSLNGDGTTNIFGTATSISATQSYVFFPLPVQMRAYPTMTQSLCVVSDLNTYDLAISAISNDQSTLTNGAALVTHASGATIYRPQMLYIANAAAFMRLSAEL